MADYNKYNARVNALTVESCTKWSPEVADLTEEERAVIAKAIHAQPQLASHVEYDRAHTGFTRTITVTAADIERIYLNNIAPGS